MQHTNNHLPGPALIADFTLTKAGISHVQLLPNPKSSTFSWHFSGDKEASLEQNVAKWVHSYCQRQQPDIELPVVLDYLPPYTKHVLMVLRHQPFGSVLSYQQLAAATGCPRGARAAGNACGRNPCPLIVPCHRILASDGKIGGFSAGLAIKQILLEFEGLM